MCVPARAPVSVQSCQLCVCVCVLSCARADRNSLVHMPELCPTVNLSPSPDRVMTLKASENQKINSFLLPVLEGSYVEH